MKTICFKLSILLLILCSLFVSCAQKEPFPCIENDGRTYELRGNTTRRIRIYEDGRCIWKKRVKADRSVQSVDPSHAMAIVDLNFDGLNDIKVAISANGKQIKEICYLQNAETGLYEESAALSELYNVGTVADQKLVLSYLGISTNDDSGETVETVLSYRWQDDSLIPYRRLTVTYYPAQDIYCFGVSDYLESTRSFDDPSEQWLSPEKHAQTDWGFFYYFQ
ncbi:MAG: hypothetical protein IKC59_08795 [Clostridia bacterium]|nr:hypothetical protein [Clostridia bacterium]